MKVTLSKLSPPSPEGEGQDTLRDISPRLHAQWREKETRFQVAPVRRVQEVLARTGALERVWMRAGDSPDPPIVMWKNNKVPILLDAMVRGWSAICFSRREMKESSKHPWFQGAAFTRRLDNQAR